MKPGQLQKFIKAKKLIADGVGVRTALSRAGMSTTLFYKLKHQEDANAKKTT
jgi:hypothetical protein